MQKLNCVGGHYLTGKGQEMDMGDEMGRTLVQVISKKYNPDDFPYSRGPGAGVVIRTSPQSSPVKG